MTPTEWAELVLLCDGIREAWASESEWAISPMMSYGQMHRESRGRGRVSKDAQAHRALHGKPNYKGAPPFTDRFQAAVGWMPRDLNNVPASMPIRAAVARMHGKQRQPSRQYLAVLRVALGLDNPFPDVPNDASPRSLLVRLRVFAATHYERRPGISRTDQAARDLLLALWHIYNSTGALPLLNAPLVNRTVDGLRALGLLLTERDAPTGDSARTGTVTRTGPPAGRSGLSPKRARV